jgi:hypothetical protein
MYVYVHLRMKIFMYIHLFRRLQKLNDYDEMIKTFVYDTHTTYTLVSDPTTYINLDNRKHLRSLGAITEFSALHITQCGHQSEIPEGTDFRKEYVSHFTYPISNNASIFDHLKIHTSN